MADSATGTWRMVESNNFDEYMKALEITDALGQYYEVDLLPADKTCTTELFKSVGLVMRKMANMAKPTLEICVNGDQWGIKTITTIKTTEISFKLHEEFNEITADGRKVKSTARLDGNRLDIEQKGEYNSLISREFNGNKMTLRLIAYDGDKEIVCTRQYLKVES